MIYHSQTKHKRHISTNLLHFLREIIARFRRLIIWIRKKYFTEDMSTLPGLWCLGSWKNSDRLSTESKIASAERRMEGEGQIIAKNEVETAERKNALAQTTFLHFIPSDVNHNPPPPSPPSPLKCVQLVHIHRAEVMLSRSRLTYFILQIIACPNLE